jgi:hypothetical protein
MSKNAAIKILILLVVATLVYSVFWFFKVGQLEKQVRNFINENSAYISSGQIAVSGFPLSQKLTIKDLKFSVPTSFLSEKQVLVKNLEAKSDIFSTSFTVSLSKEISIQDIQGNITNVEFNKDPEISFAINEGRVANFSYKDAGYRILDAEKNATYTSSESSLMFTSESEAEDKIINKISIDIKDVQGFDLGDFYKNAFEKKVVEGIKTGEITLGNNTSLDAVDNSANLADPSAANPQLASATTPVPVADAMTSEMSNAETPNQAATTEDISSAVSSDLVKNNFKMDIEYILTPNSSEQQAQAPSDPTQIQELPVQYTKTVKFNSFEFSNPLYKITINGELVFANDDNAPHGSLTLGVEKIDSLISYVSGYLSKIADEKRVVVAAPVPAIDPTAAVAPAATDAQPVPAEAAVAVVAPTLDNNNIDNSYPDFLSKMSANLMTVTKEIAAKNAVTKDDIAQFDLRREKNLEFLVNETSSREILGKF